MKYKGHPGFGGGLGVVLGAGGNYCEMAVRGLGVISNDLHRDVAARDVPTLTVPT